MLNLWIAGLCLASLVAVAAVGLLWAVESSHRRRARQVRDLFAALERRRNEAALKKADPGVRLLNGKYRVIEPESEGGEP